MRRPRAWQRAALGAALGLAAACGGAEQVYLPPPPAAEGARTLIVHVGDEDGGFATVFDASSTVWRFDVPHWGGRPPARSRFTAAYYRQTADELGVPMGMLRAAGQTARGCLLDEPLEVHVADLVDGVAMSWQTAPELEASVAEHFVGVPRADCFRPDLCTRFEVDYQPLEGSASLNFALPLDDDSALVGSSNGRFFRVWKDGREPEPQMQLLGQPNRAAAESADGTLWLGGASAIVAHGPWSGPFQWETLFTGMEALVTSIAVHPDSGELLAAGLRRLGEDSYEIMLFARRDDGWVEVGRREVPDLSRDKTRVVWVGPDEALMTYGGQSILHYVDGVLRTRVVGFANPLFDLEINDVTVHPELGVFFVANDGRIYSGAPPYDSWVAVEGGMAAVEAEAIAPFGSGLLYGGSDGLVTEYVPGGGDCLPILLRVSDSERISNVGGVPIVVGGLREAGFDNEVTWLHPQ